MAPPNEDEDAAGRSWLKKALFVSFVVMGLGIIAAVVVLVLYQTDVLSGDHAKTEGVSGGGEFLVLFYINKLILCELF